MKHSSPQQLLPIKASQYKTSTISPNIFNSAFQVHGRTILWPVSGKLKRYVISGLEHLTAGARPSNSYFSLCQENQQYSTLWLLQLE